MGFREELQLIITGKNEAGSALNDLQGKMQALGSTLMGVGTKLTTGVTLPLLGLGVIGVKNASDLEESWNKVQVVFGENADEVKRFSENAASAMGMTQATALEAAGTFGNLFSTVGLGKTASADMSTSLVQLAADLGSFNNLDPTVVLEKLRSGLVGEVEPLRTLGVNLTQAAVTAKAMEMGLADANGEVDQAGMLQARYALILDQTKLAQGDYARTSDGVANSMRTVKAEFGDMAAEIGNEILPVLKDDLLPMIKDVFNWFKNLSPEIKTGIVVVGGLAAALGPLLLGLGTLITTVSTLLPIFSAIVGFISGPVLLVIAGLAAGIAALYIGWKNNFLGIQDTVNVVFGAVKKIFEAFKLAFTGDWEGFGKKLREAWDLIWGLVEERIEAGKEFIGNVIKGIIDNALYVLNPKNWAEIGRNIVQGIADGITSAVQWVVRAVENMSSAAIAAIKGFLGISSPSEVMKRQVGWNMGLGVREGLMESLAGMEANVQTVFGGMSMAPARATAGIGGGTVINLTYAPMISTLDSYEVENKLRPVIERVIRRG